MKNDKKKIIFCIVGVLVVVAVVVLLLVSCNKQYKVELTVDSELFYSENIRKGDTLENVKTPVKDGYTFEGWYSGDEKYDVTKPITEDIKLEARWSKNEYTVTFNYDTDKENSEVKVEYEGTIEKPKNPVKKGYKFVGWYNGDEEYDFNTKIISNINITAKWEKIVTASYQVEHYLMNLDGSYNNEPTSKDSYKATIGSVVSAKVNTYVGFTSPEVEKVTVTEDGKTVVKYYYKRNKYKLNIKKETGIADVKVISKDYYYGEEIKLGYTLEKGYDFLSWTQEVNSNDNLGKLTTENYTMPASDVLLTAKGIARNDTVYTIKHCQMDLSGKYSICEDEVLKGTTDSTVKPKARTFDGFTSPEVGSLKITGDGKASLQYNYDRNTYKIDLINDGDAKENTYSVLVNGKSYDNSKEYYYGDTLEIEIKDISDGVHLDSDSKYILTIDTKDNKVNYTVNVNNYTVKFCNNDNCYEQNIKYFFDDEEVTLKKNEFTKEHYHLVGWSLDKENLTLDYEVNEDETYTLTENLTKENNGVVTLYPVWEVNHNSVIFYKNDGTNNIYDDMESNYGETLEEPTAPTREGYTFAGWYKSSDCLDNEKWDFASDTMPDEGVELYAKWEPKTDIKYVVRHCKMDLNGSYTICEEKEFHDGIADQVKSPDVETYLGFESPSVKTEKVNADGTKVFEYNYDRKTYNLTLVKGTGVENITTENKKYYYEEEITLSYNLKPGYKDPVWTQQVTDQVAEGTLTDNSYTMPASDVTLTLNSTIEKYSITYSGVDNCTDCTINEYTVEQEVNLPTSPTKEGYVFGGWYETNDSKKTRVTKINKGTTGNKSYVAIWDEIPYIKSLSFDVTDNKGTKIDSVKIGDKSFFLKMPNDGNIDFYSIKIGLTTPVKLNPNATVSTDYTDFKVDRNNNVTLNLGTLSLSIHIKSDNGGLDWYSDSKGSEMLVKTFIQALNKLNPIGIVSDFGLNGKAGTPHYVSYRREINGYTYIFFAIEGTPNVEVRYINSLNNKTVLTLQIPEGSLVPDIGNYSVTGYEFLGKWYTGSDKQTEFQFNNQVEYQTEGSGKKYINVYGDYKEGAGKTEWFKSPETDGSYKISTGDELLGLAKLVGEGNNFSGKTIYVCGDIDLENVAWTPIKNFAGNLNGYCDGKYHMISNLNINSSEGEVGMFSTLAANNRIENLKFENATVNANAGTNIGVLAGSISGSVNINKISVNKVSVNGSNQVGGIVGAASGSATIQNVSVTDGKIYAGATDAGGVAAIVHGSVTIKNVYADVTVEVISSLAPDVGGIIGNYDNSTYQLKMSNVLFTGKIIQSSSFFLDTYGPIYGRLGSGGMGNDKYTTDGTSIKNDLPTWLYDSTIYTIGHKERGTGKSTTDLQNSSTYDGWDDSIWNISEMDGKSYPKLRWIYDLEKN